MSESEFVLAIDAGTHRLTAVTACVAPSGENKVASFAVGGGRDSIAMLAVVTADGDLLFGDEAERAAALHPERALRDVVGRIGDDVPLVAAGFAVLPEQVLARLVLWVAAAVAAEHGSRPAAITLAHPPHWQGHRVRLVEQALRELDLDAALMPGPVAAVYEQADAAGATAPGLHAVFDLGGSTCTATVVRTGNARVRQIAPAVVIDDIGGGGFDDALLAHALAMTGIDGQRAVQDAEGRAMLIAARAAAVAAKESLSFDGDAEMVVPLAEREARVRITRSEFEGMITRDIERAVESLDMALEQAQLSPSELTEVLLVGGSAGIPLVVQQLSTRFDVALVAAADPQQTIARGAARKAALALTAPPTVEPVADVEQPPADDEPPRRARMLRMFGGRAAKIATPAASAAALTVTAVLVGGGIILGTTAPAGDRSDAAEPEDIVAAGLGADLFGGARHDSDFSATGGAAADALSDVLAESLGVEIGHDVAVSEPRSRTPQAPGDPSSPPKADSSSGSSSGSPSTSGGSDTSDPSPSDPAPSDPAPSDPAPSDPAPSDPAPSDPAPSDPAPADPAPSDPAPSDPAASDPPPADPQPADPAPTDPSSSPVDPQPPEPDPSPPAAEDPTSPPADLSPAPAP